MKDSDLFKKYSIYYRVRINLLFIILFLSVAASEVLAHKVNIFAYVEGGTVFTESYFNDGKKCIKSKIEVFDNTGDKLLEGITDKTGEFSFKVPGKTNLKIVLTASMGHRDKQRWLEL